MLKSILNFLNKILNSKIGFCIIVTTVLAPVPYWIMVKTVPAEQCPPIWQIMLFVYPC